MGFKKNFFTFFGGVMLTISLITLGFSVSNFISPVKVKDPYAVKEFAITNCKSNLRKLKLSGEFDKRNRVTINTVGLDNWAYDLGIYSMAVQGCKGFNILAFCQGESCITGKDGAQNGTSLRMIFTKKL